MNSSIKVVGTGSSGNSYLLTCGNETLIIECGKRFKDVKISLNFNLRDIVGAITTHCHGDHYKYASEYELTGIPVWTPWKDNNLRQVRRFGGFKVSSFECIHDVPCVGYLIEHPDSGLKMLYATDTEYVRYTFKGLTTILLEANYSEEYVNRDEAKYRHVLEGHTSIETAIECIKANMNDGLKNIILCHLSKGNSDPGEFKASVKAIVPDGVQVDIATPKLTVRLN